MPTDDLVAELEIITNNLVLGCAALAFLDLPSCHDMLDIAQMTFPGYRVPGAQIADALRDERRKTHVLGEFAKMLLRTFVRDAYQVVEEYCRNTNQLVTLSKQPWYQFARLMRNSLSHGSRLDLGDYVKRQQLPIEWVSPISGEEVTVTKEMDGCSLNTRQLSLTRAWELLQQMQQFAQAGLS